jgi:hypothetical protein
VQILFLYFSNNFLSQLPQVSHHFGILNFVCCDLNIIVLDLGHLYIFLLLKSSSFINSPYFCLILASSTQMKEVEICHLNLMACKFIQHFVTLALLANILREFTCLFEKEYFIFFEILEAFKAYHPSIHLKFVNYCLKLILKFFIFLRYLQT